jgi:anti-sigma factor RsiW
MKGIVMDCREIKKRLSPYQDGELPEEESTMIAYHIASCPDCAQELRTLQTTSLLLKGDTEVEPSPDFLSQVVNRVSREDERYLFFRKPYWPLNSLPTSARLTIGLILAIFIGVGLGSITSPDERGTVIVQKQERNAVIAAALENFQSVHPQSLTQAYINLTSSSKS